MRHAAAVDQKSSKKSSPHKFMRTQKLHLKEPTPHIAKQKKKGDGKKGTRASPSSKRKTPSKTPVREQLNVGMNEIDAVHGNSAAYNRESASKMTGTIFSSSVEKQGPQTQA